MTEILDIANQMAQDLFKVGAMDEITMRKIDALCLPPQRPFRPELVKLTSGDELVGLTRGFIYTRTPSIVASLWSVNDQSTTAVIPLLSKIF